VLDAGISWGSTDGDKQQIAGFDDGSMATRSLPALTNGPAWTRRSGVDGTSGAARKSPAGAKRSSPGTARRVRSAAEGSEMTEKFRVAWAARLRSQSDALALIKP
jgi:hypothetical protein